MLSPHPPQQPTWDEDLWFLQPHSLSASTDLRPQHIEASELWYRLSEASVGDPCTGTGTWSSQHWCLLYRTGTHCPTSVRKLILKPVVLLVLGCPLFR